MWGARVAKSRDRSIVGRSRVQFSLRSLMITVAAVGGLFTLALSPAGLVVLFGLLYLALIGVLWWMFHGFRRLSALSCGVVGASVNILSAALCIYALNLGGAVLIFLGWCWTFPVVISTGVAWASAATWRTARPRRSPWLAWPLVLVVALLPLSMLVTFWPFRLAFLASRPAMDRLADRVGAGHAVTGPEWAGLFRVVSSVVDPSTGDVGLVVAPDPSGRCGFVRVELSPGVPVERSNGTFSNLNFDLQLSERWWYECED
jgi:hypothetical protein